MLCGTLTMAEQNYPLPPPPSTHTYTTLFIQGRFAEHARLCFVFTHVHIWEPPSASTVFCCWLPSSSSSSTAAAERSGRLLFFPDCSAVFKIFVTQLFMFVNHHIFPYCGGTALHVRTVKLAFQPVQLETTQVRSWRLFSGSVIINYIHKFRSVYKFYISGVYPHLNQRSLDGGCYSL